MKVQQSIMQWCFNTPLLVRLLSYHTSYRLDIDFNTKVMRIECSGNFLGMIEFQDGIEHITARAQQLGLTLTITPTLKPISCHIPTFEGLEAA
ncbi:MAG: hypothetical protein F6K19_48710 [Cyanothece sp. SIO1E1]|nr:hypothetical protein [Cyanothece sp. SIO1E1]